MKEDFWEPLGPAFSEDTIWTDKIKPLLAGAPENIIHICAYGFTEMMNNANDHSGASMVHVSLSQADDHVTIQIIDLGVGIFDNLMAKLHLEDIRHAVFELTKGKLTTDPERHTGEGIFYTSRMFDKFSILSGEVFISRTDEQDWLLTDDSSSGGGTVVTLMINKNSQRTTKEVFDHYASEQDDYGFKKTTVTVSLAHEGRTLISRSQAKRVVSRLDKFHDVLLNFKDIDSITPAFADEVFRVFSKAHPDVKIRVVLANDDVMKMIAKARAESQEETL